MRKRLSRKDRRSAILDQARALFAQRGFSDTEMEDIRLACGISRGGLYHHFANKRAVLDALVEAEVAQLVAILEDTGASPIPTLLRAMSSHLGSSQGVISGLKTRPERLDYLSSLELALPELLIYPLGERLGGYVRPDVDPTHLAELFLTINTHINRREILGEWTSGQAAGFAATALQALAPFLSDPSELDPIIASLKEASSR
ncbi:TetR/AcrR family transcriptional regulator [Thalassovita sp.]|jgi:AcrR family transcriptional regulator|uniref:TetR/AcrR family transcriptional regulator n=1 Tax=Thalassovita sp. TaxID=1979401 RepID=UPI003B5A2099